MKRCAFTLLTLSSLVLLSACAPYQPGGDMHSRVCNELNSRIIFNGNTYDTRKSEIDSSELPLYQKSYEKNNCG